MSAKGQNLARRMRDALSEEIKRLTDVQSRLDAVDNEILVAAYHTFEGELGAALWLSEEQRALDGRIPIEVASTPDGKESVLQVLRAIDYGIYL